jgi:hypothetical protein
VPAAKSLDLAEGQLKSGENIVGPCGMRPDRSQDGHILVAVTELKGASAKYELTMEWSHDGQYFVTADPPDTFTVAEPGVVRHFVFRAPIFRIRETLTGARASVTRAIHIQYD